MLPPDLLALCRHCTSKAGILTQFPKRFSTGKFQKPDPFESPSEFVDKSEKRRGTTFMNNRQSGVYFNDNFKTDYGKFVENTDNLFISLVKRVEESAIRAHRDLALTSLDKYFQQLEIETQSIERYRVQYQESKHNLAQMMDRDPNEFTDEEVQQSIQYLMPSSLHAKENRPQLRPPESLFKYQKAPRFDSTGRPLSFMFYTGHDNFYSALHELAAHVNTLNDLADDNSPDNAKFEMTDFRWLTLDELKKKFYDKKLTDDMCTNLVNSLKFLSTMDYSAQSSQFLESFMGKLVSFSHEKENTCAPVINNGIQQVEARGARKTAKASVLLKTPGTGLLTINGQSIQYFDNILDRHQLLGPLSLSRMLNKVDISSSVSGGGHSSQAGAVRLAISRALFPLLTSESVEIMRQAGYLTRDPRVKERKKAGKEGSRRGFTWLKR